MNYAIGIGLERYWEVVDPILAALANAPIDDEEISEQEEQAVAQARESLIKRGGVPHSEAMRLLGLE